MAVIILVIVTASLLTNSLVLPKRLNFSELSEHYGHKCEEHRVVTEDGYILTVFRIPGKRKPPVLLLHGLQDSSDAYILRGNRSLAIFLANKDYDVWAGNTRGNRYARQHITLNPDLDLSFWDYSFHEHGYYDLAAITDYILNATGEKSLRSIGYSEGSTDHFVLGSTRPEYNKKFNIFIAIGPSAFLNHLSPLLTVITEIASLLDQLVPSGFVELFKEGSVESKLAELICTMRGNTLCREILFQTGGYDLKRIELEFFPKIFRHFLTSGSRKGFLHYGQVATRKRFAWYDYGPEGNLMHYGSRLAPDYNLKEMTMRTALFVGKNDLVNGIENVEQIRVRLPNVVRYHLMEPKEWNHFDFIWGNDMPETLFPHILSLLDKY